MMEFLFSEQHSEEKESEVKKIQDLMKSTTLYIMDRATRTGQIVFDKCLKEVMEKSL